MRLNRFTYIYPPRPSTAIPYKSETYESLKTKPDFVAQFKLNGQRNLIYIFPDGHIELWNRHREQHRSYTMPKWLANEISRNIACHPGQFTVIDGELLHLKDKGVKDTLYLWDVLVLNGEYFVGTTYDSRYNKLLDIVKTNGKTPNDLALAASDHIWVAYNILPSEWDDQWGKTSTSYVEGFVFKNVKSKLGVGTSERNNGNSMIRCRKLNKNYDY